MRAQVNRLAHRLARVQALNGHLRARVHARLVRRLRNECEISLARAILERRQAVLRRRRGGVGRRRLAQRLLPLLRELLVGGRQKRQAHPHHGAILAPEHDRALVEFHHLRLDGVAVVTGPDPERILRNLLSVLLHGGRLLPRLRGPSPAWRGSLRSSGQREHPSKGPEDQYAETGASVPHRISSKVSGTVRRRPSRTTVTRTVSPALQTSMTAA